MLHTPGYSEFLNHVTTSYSCAVVEPTGVRLKLNSKEVGVEKAEQLANDTFNLVHHFSTNLGNAALAYMQSEEILSKKLGGTYGTDGGHSSHSQQNN